MATRPSSPRVAASNGPQQALWHDTILDAIGAAVQAAGGAKVVAGQLGIDAATWCRIRKGNAHFPQDRLDALCDLTGTEIPLQWWAQRRGYDLVPKLSTLERENAELRRQLADRDRDLDTIKRFVAETRR